MAEHLTSPSAKLAAVRKQMAREGLDGFLVTRADRFQGEEVRAEDEYLAWLTGFTGSAGVALILADKAVVASDSRYTVQLTRQVETSLYDTIDTGQLSLKDRMAAVSAEQDVNIGFDSWAVTKAGLEGLPAHLGKDEIHWHPVSAHPVAAVWTDRPVSQQTDIFAVDEGYTGLKAEQKLSQAAQTLQQNGLDLQFISAPDVMMWLTNLRGRDLQFTPVHLCFGILTAQKELIFITDNGHLEKQGYKTVHWADLEAYLHGLSGQRIGCDPASLPVAVQDSLSQAGLELVFRPDPLVAQKARKTPAELDGFRQAHLLDGLALSRFFYWLETEADRTTLGEAELGRKLTAFRAATDGYICDSFSTIAGWGDHGAIVHYRAEDGQDYTVSGSGVLLLDSGAHYSCGSTDITRTVFLAEAGQSPDPEIVRKASFVLAAHCQLAGTIFPAGTNGVQLDAICRAPLWAEGLNFGHGTGHGVGHILNVHEGPISISKRGEVALQAGHILSNEPGYYEEGRFGIRHETLVHVTEGRDGYLGFETLTCFPFDRQLIDPACLSAPHIDWLNSYHRSVYDRLAPHLEPEIADWLAGKCAPL